MRKNLFICLVLVCFYYSGYSQIKHKNYITNTGLILDQVQLDSVKNSGLPVGIIGDTLINGITLRKVKIYDSILSLNSFTTRHEGNKLPDFEVRLINGKHITKKDLEGKIVMINLWSTSCKPCIVELPGLNKLQEEYKDKVIFLAPLEEDKLTTEKFLKRFNFTFQLAPNSTELFKALEVNGYPKNLFIDRKGIIRKVTEGTPKRRDSLEGDWYISVFEDYSEILDELLTEEQF